MTETGITLHDPPRGKIYDHVDGPTAFMCWAPGNGYIYQLLMSELPAEAVQRTSGRVMISVTSHEQNRFVSYAGNPRDIYVLEFVQEKWPVRGDEHILFTAMLMNWAIFGTEMADGYAEELWQEAERRWPEMITK